MGVAPPGWPETGYLRCHCEAWSHQGKTQRWTLRGQWVRLISVGHTSSTTVFNKSLRSSIVIVFRLANRTTWLWISYRYDAHPVSASVCLSVRPLSTLPDSSWDMWLGCAEVGTGSSCVAEAGLLVSIGDPSNCDTPTGTGSEISAISGLREAKKENKTDFRKNNLKACWRGTH